MNWYVKLFRPLIAGACLLLIVITLLWLDVDPDESIARLLAFVAVIIATWGLIQPLYFPKRPHKSTYRLLITVSILGFALVPLWLIAFKDDPDELLFVLVLSTLSASIGYLLRHKKAVYSLAPGWAQIKHLCLAFALIGWTLFMAFLLGVEVFRMRSLERLIFSLPDFILILVIAPWYISQGVIAISHYVEAILHHRRNSDEIWQQQINKLGE